MMIAGARTTQPTTSAATTTDRERRAEADRECDEEHDRARRGRRGSRFASRVRSTSRSACGGGGPGPSATDVPPVQPSYSDAMVRPSVRVEWRERVVVVTIDRPERRNAVDHATLVALVEAAARGGRGRGSGARAHRRTSGVLRRCRPHGGRERRVRRRARRGAVRVHDPRHRHDRRCRRTPRSARGRSSPSPATCGCATARSVFGIPAAEARSRDRPMDDRACDTRARRGASPEGCS